MKTGWCLDGHHRDCWVTIKSVGKPPLVCACSCHEEE